MSEIYYYYSIRSDFAYLGAHRIVALAKKFNAKLIHRPIKLSVVMGPIGGAPFDNRPPMRGAYSQLDARRWAQFLGMEKHDDPVHHDGPMELPSGVVIVAQRWVDRGEKGDHHELHRLILESLWRYDRHIADPRLITELAEQASFDAPKLVRDALSEFTQAELARNCREAITKGVMGSPSYFVDGENFYGQDRLDFVERKLQGAA